jgi:glycosyltransferase involved in cell wall biosynthesis
MAGYEKVDIIHDHTLSRTTIDIPIVNTLHGPANPVTVKRCVELSENSKNNFVSISNRQKELHLLLNRNINFVATVYNSVNVNRIDWSGNKEEYFLFVGRANWEKGLDLAVRVASKANVGLVMAIKMNEDFEKQFFKKEIEPWIKSYPKNLLFKFYGEISRDIKFNLYKRAKCTLFTSQWEEPFGLVMIESMAAGTPVIALRRGAAPEVIADGKTGFVVDTEEEMIEATKLVDKIKPEDCRKHVEKNFSREKMARDYLEVYEKVLAKCE